LERLADADDGRTPDGDDAGEVEENKASDIFLLGR
jgi:hypothetical protein